MRGVGRWWIALVVAGGFLYAPILLLMTMSFNASRSPFTWQGFSLHWYGELFRDEELMRALGTSLFIAVCVSVISTVLGTMLAVGLTRFRAPRLLEGAVLTPALLPDLIIAIGLLVFFTTINLPLGTLTVILAHASYSTAFVVAIVRARIAGTDPSVDEAARDLGAGPITTFVKVTLPSIAPAVVAGGALAFTLSLDEFVVAVFNAGPTTLTLPIAIYSRIKTGITPEINALATVLILLTVLVVVGASRAISKPEES